MINRCHIKQNRLDEGIASALKMGVTKVKEFGSKVNTKLKNRRNKIETKKCIKQVEKNYTKCMKNADWIKEQVCDGIKQASMDDCNFETFTTRKQGKQIANKYPNLGDFKPPKLKNRGKDMVDRAMINALKKNK